MTRRTPIFADGIQDDVLTNLAKIGDLKVISRTSVMPYRGQTPNIREIGKALNVATILEGSVRREGKRVRINVQLIDAVTDKHLWAQIYDRELTDVFAIQSELAQEIASALKATLSLRRTTRIEKKANGKRRGLPALSRGARNLRPAGSAPRRRGPRRIALRKSDPARSRFRAGARAPGARRKLELLRHRARGRRGPRKRGRRRTKPSVFSPIFRRPIWRWVTCITMWIAITKRP